MKSISQLAIKHNIIDRLEKIDISQPDVKCYLKIEGTDFEVKGTFKNLSTGHDYIFDLRSADGEAWSVFVVKQKYELYHMNCDGGVEWWRKPDLTGETLDIGYWQRICGEVLKIF